MQLDCVSTKIYLRGSDKHKMSKSLVMWEQQFPGMSRYIVSCYSKVYGLGFSWNTSYCKVCEGYGEGPQPPNLLQSQLAKAKSKTLNPKQPWPQPVTE